MYAKGGQQSVHIFQWFFPILWWWLHVKAVVHSSSKWVKQTKFLPSILFFYPTRFDDVLKSDHGHASLGVAWTNDQDPMFLYFYPFIQSSTQEPFEVWSFGCSFDGILHFMEELALQNAYYYIFADNGQVFNLIWSINTSQKIARKSVKNMVYYYHPKSSIQSHARINHPRIFTIILDIIKLKVFGSNYYYLRSSNIPFFINHFGYIFVSFLHCNYLYLLSTSSNLVIP